MDIRCGKKPDETKDLKTEKTIDGNSIDKSSSTGS